MADTDERIIRIENKIDKVVEHIGSIDVTLAAQYVSLADHIRRTELLEKDVAPIKAHVNMVHGVLKLAGLLATLGVILEGVMALLTYLRK